MTSDRPYRPAGTVAVAVAELRACAESQFDPRVVRALAAVLSEDRDAAASPGLRARLTPPADWAWRDRRTKSRARVGHV
jgi:HD-GYP domain-containing protein (c-di-GMP phosphodiesterase class II)